MSVAGTLRASAKKLFGDERGEVTIAWVAITAGIIGLSITLLMRIGDGAQELSGDVGDEVSTREISSTF